MGASYWLGLGHSLCPTGVLTIGGSWSAGTVFVWSGDEGYHDGGVPALARGGWSLFDCDGSLRWGAGSASAVIYARALAAGESLSIPITRGEWAGGVAFRENVTIPDSRFKLAWPGGPAADLAPRRMEVGRRVHHAPRTAMTWDRVMPEQALDPIFSGAYFWPGVHHFTPWQFSFTFETSVMGTFFFLDWNMHNKLDNDARWDYLGLITPTAANVYSTFLVAGASLSVEPFGKIQHTFAFRENFHIKDVWKSTSSIVEAKRTRHGEGAGSGPPGGGDMVGAVLTHSRQIYGELTSVRQWHANTNMWATQEWQIISLSDQLVGAWSFVPSLPRAYGLQATLTFESFVGGSLLMWHGGSIGLPGDKANEVYRLDDDPALGWTLAGSIIVEKIQSAVVYRDELMVYAKAVVPGSIQTYASPGQWTGGVAFSHNRSLAAVRFPFALSTPAGTFDDVPRRVGQHTRMWTEYSYSFFDDIFTSALDHSYSFGPRLGGEMQSFDFTTNVPGTFFIGVEVHLVDNAQDKDATAIDDVWSWARQEGHAWCYMGIGLRIRAYGKRFEVFGAYLDAGSSVSFETCRGCYLQGFVGFSTVFNLTAAMEPKPGPARWTHRHWWIEHSGVLNPGVKAFASEPEELVYNEIPVDMQGITFWPSVEGFKYPPPGTLELTTDVGGAAFVWTEGQGRRTGGVHALDDDPADGWAYFDSGLCVRKVDCFVVYAKNLHGPSVVSIPYSSPWLGGVGFKEATVNLPARPLRLAHTSLSFDDIPRPLGSGAFAWTDHDGRQWAYNTGTKYDSVPAALASGASFWPGLPRSSVPVGTLVFTTAVPGHLFVWGGSGGLAQGKTGGLEALPSEWVQSSENMTTGDGSNYSVRSTFVRFCSRTEVGITKEWEGGVAFSPEKGVAPRSCATLTSTATSTTSQPAPTEAAPTAPPPPAPTAAPTKSPTEAGGGAGAGAWTKTTTVATAGESTTVAAGESATTPEPPEEPCCTMVPAEFAKKWGVVLCDHPTAPR